jgi:hypothetical protein
VRGFGTESDTSRRTKRSSSPRPLFFQRIVIRRETNVSLDLGEQLAKPEAAKLETPPETVSP